MSTVKDNYHAMVTTMQSLCDALVPALAAQYDAPPQSTGRGASAAVTGISNPTLDIVADPRRWALSDEIEASALALRQARALLDPHVHLLRRAVAHWEGQGGPTA